jgi:hypothetical protein
MYFIPQYENSFYFYFGLKDGNTAIDRLYNEYYAPCNTDNGAPSVSFIVEEDYSSPNDGWFRFKIHCNTTNMGYLKWASVKNNGVLYSDWNLDKKRGIINISFEHNGTKLSEKFLITLKDNRNQMIKGVVVCKHTRVEIISYKKVSDSSDSSKTIIKWTSSMGVYINSITDSVSGDMSDNNISDDKLSGTFKIKNANTSRYITFTCINGKGVTKIEIK